MIEFKVVEDRCPGPIVNELRALVEERRVVFVRFDHELAAIRGKPRRYPEITGDAADQEVGPQAFRFQDPCQHGAGGGLAMRARHSQYMLTLQDLFTEPLRA